MTTLTLTGRDTITLTYKGESIPITDVPDGDTATVTFPNERVTLKAGKNGNVIYAENAEGVRVDMELRVLVGSGDDKRLNSIEADLRRDFVGFQLINVDFVKKTGDGSGNITRTNYQLTGGIISKGIDTKENVEGDTEQAVAVYAIKFGNGKRIL